MSFLNALTPGQWLILAAVPLAIVALYFLKLRRQMVKVPSTYLWTRTVEDLHVNSLWQRLRQSLLLFLQLLLVALAMLACLRPGWRGTQLVGDRFVFLVDTSASMSATDLAPSRLDVAKRRGLDMIDQMKSGDVAMLITFSDTARVEQSFSDNRGLLRQKVKRIQPTPRRSDLREALRAAAGLANPGRTSQDATDIQVAEAMPATLYILSDGGFAPVPNFSLGHLTTRYIAIGSPQADNVGIVAFSAERNSDKPDQTQAFARLQNSGPRAVALDVALYLNQQLVDARHVDVPAAGEEAVEFQLNAIEEGVLELDIQREDQLSLDNRAWAALGIPRRARVLLATPGNELLQLALTTDQAQKAADVSVVTPEEAAGDTLRELAAAGTYDLVIYDQCVPQVMPQANTLFVGNVPPTAGWSKGERRQLPAIIDTDRSHALTDLVEMGNVKWIYDGFSVQGLPGSLVLFDSTIGPLLVVGQRDGFEDAVLGFEIYGKDEQGNAFPKTDWPTRRSFPVFCMNVLHYLGGQRGAQTLAGVQPGVPVTLRSHLPVDQLEVQSPSGAASHVSQEGQQVFGYGRTDELGVYEVREGRSREVTQRFTVNLCDNRESNLTPRSEIELGYQKVAGRPGSEPSRKEFWKWLLMAALAVLLFEWYVYHRRVYL